MEQNFSKLIQDINSKLLQSGIHTIQISEEIEKSMKTNETIIKNSLKKLIDENKKLNER